MKDEVGKRIASAVATITPFRVHLSPRPGVFTHGTRGAATVWLDPVEADAGQARLGELQENLQKEFEECDTDPRGFTPHLSVGQAKRREGVDKLGREVEMVVRGFLGDGGYGVGRGNGDADEGRAEALGGARGESLDLEWWVDRVYVIRRKGYKDRFKVVGEVMLGNG